jgi:trimeric autotransporter adhesin
MLGQKSFGQNLLLVGGDSPMKNALFVVVFVFVGLLAGCSSGSSNSSPTLTAIAVTPASPSVPVGQTQQFKAVGTYSNNTTQDLTASAAWSSSTVSVATIGAGGLATAVGAGGTTITASVGAFTAAATLNVTIVSTLQSISVAPVTTSIQAGQTLQYSAIGTYDDGSNQVLTTTATWASSVETVATIAAGGLATAVGPGTTAITASVGSVTGTAALTVTPTLTSIVLSGAPTVTIANGTSYQFTAYGFYNDGSRHNITTQAAWSSSNTAAAAVGATTGRAVSVAPGSTTITAALDSVNGTATLVVTNAMIVSIVVGPSTTTIEPLTVQAFTAIGTFSDASNQNITHDVTWASTTPATATISNSSGSVGVATGVAAGSTTISATFGAVSGSAPLMVGSAALSSIAVTSPSAAMAVGSQLALQAVGNFSDGSSQHIETVGTWTSSDTSVATLNANIVSGVANGSVTITCSLNGVSGTASLTVEGFTGITISPTTPTVAAGTSTGLTATGTLTDGTTQDMTNSVAWTSSSSTVATISNASGLFGMVAGNAPGSATITASLAGVAGTSTLTVTSATLTAIAITPANPNIALGSRQSFSAKGTFSDGSKENLASQVTWSSSDVTVAIINSNGSALTTGTGTTTIEATLGGVSTTTTLTVH